jgi:UDP-N-acetyl-D-glucosamine dehydrogenase
VRPITFENPNQKEYEMRTSAAAALADLKQRMETREARIGIVGMGYVGLPLALLFSEERFRVTGFDIAQDKVRRLTPDGSYIVRILPRHYSRRRRQASAPPRTTQRSEMDASSSAFPPRSTSITSPT